MTEKIEVSKKTIRNLLRTIKSAEKRLDKMKVKDCPDPNILSYELSVSREMLQDEI